MPAPHQPLRNIIACHCTRCHKASGAGASHNKVVSKNAGTFTSRQPKFVEDTALSGNVLKRYFCGDYG